MKKYVLKILFVCLVISMILSCSKKIDYAKICSQQFPCIEYDTTYNVSIDTTIFVDTLISFKKEAVQISFDTLINYIDGSKIITKTVEVKVPIEKKIYITKTQEKIVKIIDTAITKSLKDSIYLLKDDKYKLGKSIEYKDKWLNWWRIAFFVLLLIDLLYLLMKYRTMKLF